MTSECAAWHGCIASGGGAVNQSLRVGNGAATDEDVKIMAVGNSWSRMERNEGLCVCAKSNGGRSSLPGTGINGWQRYYVSSSERAAGEAAGEAAGGADREAASEQLETTYKALQEEQGKKVRQQHKQ
jgi:hypothetical protein